MKNILGVIILSVLFCNFSFADITWKNAWKENKKEFKKITKQSHKKWKINKKKGYKWGAETRLSVKPTFSKTCLTEKGCGTLIYFVEHGMNEIEAAENVLKLCEPYRKKYSKYKLYCHDPFIRSPGKFQGYYHYSKYLADEKRNKERDEQEKRNAKKNSSNQGIGNDIESMINQAKNTCKSLGFKEGTVKFTDCSLKLYSQSLDLAAKNNQQVIVQNQGNSSDTIKVFDVVRDRENTMRKAKGLIDGSCTLANYVFC